MSYKKLCHMHLKTALKFEFSEVIISEIVFTAPCKLVHDRDNDDENRLYYSWKLGDLNKRLSLHTVLTML